MSNIKIYYEKFKTSGIKNKNLISFDSAMGTGVNKNYPYNFKFTYNGKIYWNNSEALQIMGQPNWSGKSFFEILPILPKLPPEYISTTIWLPYPENAPGYRAQAYRCHFLQPDGKIGLTWLLSDDLTMWNSLGVFEYTEGIIEGDQKIPNPDYPPAKDIYDAKWEEYDEIIRGYFILAMNVVSPNIPTTDDNTKLIPELMEMLGLSDPLQIPDKYFWQWWFVNPDGTKTPTVVTPKQYEMPPIVIDDKNHERYDYIINYTIKNNDLIARVKSILNFGYPRTKFV